MTDAVDEHFQLVRDVRAEDRLRRVLQFLSQSGVRAVVEGGWAVSGHGSPIESVDVDVLVHSADYPRLEAAALRMDIQLDARATAEALGLDLRYSDEFNALFRKPHLGYVPDEVLRNRIANVGIRTVRGDIHFRAPDPAALLLMKLKAFHDRRIQFEVSVDPRQLVWLDQDDAMMVRSQSPAYWERKAGKDLFDVGFLLATYAGAHGGMDLVEKRMRDALLEALVGIPEALNGFARDMAKRVGVDAVAPDAIRDRLVD